MGWWVLAALAGPLDLNAATVQELDGLRGVGPSKAASIVAWRVAHGACKEPKEILEAPGIGLGTWAAIRGAVSCGDGVAAPGVFLHPPPPVRQPTAVNINRASAAEMLLLAGMSPARAALVVSDRDARGSYATCREVTRIPGFSMATVSVWGERCVAD